MSREARLSAVLGRSTTRPCLGLTASPCLPSPAGFTSVTPRSGELSFALHPTLFFLYAVEPKVWMAGNPIHDVINGVESPKLLDDVGVQDDYSQ